MDRHHLRSGGYSLQGSEVQAPVGIPELVSVLVAKREILNALLPPERGSQRVHLLGHPEGKVVGPVRRTDDPAVDPVAARRTEHRQPAEFASLADVAQPGGVQKVPGRFLRKA